MTVDAILPTPGPAADEMLFGAAAAAPEAGVFNPQPVVTINGVDVPAAAGVHLPGQVVVDGVTVTWGREDLLVQPEPASGQLQLFDTTGTWATSRDLRGLPVTIRWQGLPPGTTDPMGTASETFFCGRVGNPVNVALKTVTNPHTGERVDGVLVTLPLRSLLVDLANRVPTEAWPEETMAARLARIQALAPDVLAVAELRDYWQPPHVEPVPLDRQQSLLDHLRSLFDSAGADRMTYIPNTRALTFVRRRDYGYRQNPSLGNRGMAGLFWDAPTVPTKTSRTGQGIYALAFAWTGTPASPNLPGWIDAAAIEADPTEGLRSAARVTRVQVVNPDGGNNFTDRVTEYPVRGVDENLVGVRTARLDSSICWNGYAEVAGDDLRDLVNREGSQWQLPPLRYSTRHAGGFESLAQARILLAGAETGTTVFLQRSWLPRMGLRPVFGICGGTITYARGGWDVEFAVAPTTTGETPQHAITWEEIDDGTTGLEVQWWDTDHPRGMHESLSLDDLGYVARGLGVATIPADTGWDRAQ